MDGTSSDGAAPSPVASVAVALSCASNLALWPQSRTVGDASPWLGSCFGCELISILLLGDFRSLNSTLLLDAFGNLLGLALVNPARDAFAGMAGVARQIVVGGAGTRGFGDARGAIVEIPNGIRDTEAFAYFLQALLKACRSRHGSPSGRAAAGLNGSVRSSASTQRTTSGHLSNA